MEACEPAVDGVDALLVDLNQTNDFARFVQTMRRMFKQLVEQDA